MLLPIHIAAVGLAMVLGFTALFAKKGGAIHRRSGLLFVCAMLVLVMGISASILGFRKSPTDGNVFAGLMTAYFVAALAVAVGLALGAMVSGVRNINSPLLSPGGAAGSFFSIRERVATILPEPFTTGPMRALPFVLLFGAMFYWLWRVRGRRTLPALQA